MNLSGPVTLKPTGLSNALSGFFFFTPTWFCNFMHWSFGKYWFRDLCRAPQCEHTALDSIKVILVNITTDLVRKFLSAEKGSGSWWWIQVFSLSYRFTWFIFLRKCIPVIQVWITIVYLLSFKAQRGLYGKKVASSVHDPITNALPQDSHGPLIRNKCTHSSRGILKGCALQGQDLTKFIIFTVS